MGQATKTIPNERVEQWMRDLDARFSEIQLDETSVRNCRSH